MVLNYLQQAASISPFTLVTSLVALLLGIVYIKLKNKGLPPGPYGLPIVGYWPFLQHETIHLQLQELTKKYGDVFSFNVAGKLFINLGSLKSCKEAHITKSDCFSKRYTDYNIMTFTLGKGIVTVNGEEWKALRKFFVQSFKEYGLTSLKDYLTDTVYDSRNEFVEALKSTKGEPVNIISTLNIRSLKILRRMMFNDAEVTEEEIKEMLDAYGNLIMVFMGKNPLLIGNFAKKYLYPRISGYEESIRNHMVMEKCLRNIIKRHERTFDAANIRDIIDSYIKERRDRTDKGDPSAEYFSEESLIGSLIEFVGDGTLSIAIFISYFIHALLEYPEEQEKIYKELVEVVGNSREVTLEDRNNLPYMNAFMQEVIRTTDMFTYFASLECTKETTINGHKIPVGAITIINFWTSHRDQAVFEEPDDFKPSRYMPGPGKPKAELPILFGIGKRSCAGESYAMMQVFLFLTAIIKNFTIKRPVGEDKKSFVDGKMNICVVSRKGNLILQD